MPGFWGNAAPVDAFGIRVSQLEQASRTVILASRGGRALGLLAFGDALRPDAAATVTALRRAGIRTLLVSGDNAAACRRVAAEAGVDEAHGELLPQ